jgi:hypothetical protein
MLGVIGAYHPWSDAPVAPSGVDLLVRVGIPIGVFLFVVFLFWWFMRGDRKK